jgi:hypothetical protein
MCYELQLCLVLYGLALASSDPVMNEFFQNK